MTGWRRRQEVPVEPLTEDRRRLVHSYMDAEEEKVRREAIEERERLARIREQARRPAAELGAAEQADAAAEARGKLGQGTAGQSSVLAEAVAGETPAEAARRFAA